MSKFRDSNKPLLKRNRVFHGPFMELPKPPPKKRTRTVLFGNVKKGKK